MVKTDAFRQWAVSLIICALGGTLISLLLPRGSIEKTLRAVIGIFVVSAICTPLVKLKKTDLFLPVFTVQATPDIETENLREQTENACKNTVGKAVDEIMKTVGIDDYDVNVDMYIDEQFCIIIQEVQIKTIAADNAPVKEMQAALQERLGVPVSVICE